MGASSSRKRKVTVENEDTTGVIKVSDDVVERLKGYQTAGVSNPNAPWPQNSNVVVVQYPYFDAPLTSLQLRQENVDKLKENDSYWQKRLDKMEQSYTQMQQEMESEYNRVIEETGMGKTKPDLKSPCDAIQLAVMQCYKQNSKEPIKCAALVEEFTKCVDNHRACILEKK